MPLVEEGLLDKVEHTSVDGQYGKKNQNPDLHNGP